MFPLIPLPNKEATTYEITNLRKEVNGMYVSINSTS